MLLKEAPLITSARDLPQKTLAAVLDVADADINAYLKYAHGFLRAGEEEQERFLNECCGEEGLGSAAEALDCSVAELPRVKETQAQARWLVEHDPACASVDPARLARALCVFTQNSFSTDHASASSACNVTSKIRESHENAGNNQRRTLSSKGK